MRGWKTGFLMDPMDLLNEICVTNTTSTNIMKYWTNIGRDQSYVQSGEWTTMLESYKQKYDIFDIHAIPVYLYHKHLKSHSSKFYMECLLSVIERYVLIPELNAVL